jgi:hypothetical protein
MAAGDATDMLARIKRVVPSRWFAYVAPLRDAVLGGLADQLSWSYSLIAFAKLQTRISTATGFFLDLIAFDYFGRLIRRRVAEMDAPFMVRIKKELVRERVTRAGMIQALTDLTGRAPIVFEPSSTFDAGGYGTHCGYGVAGGYGNVALNNQVFLTVYRPGLQGVPDVDGYGGGLGGYGVGAIEYVGPDMMTGAVTDADIYATIEATKPTGTICWTKLLGAMPATIGGSFAIGFSPIY